MSSDPDVTRAAVDDLREALAALHDVPAAALGGEQHDQLVDAVDSVQALETALMNELDQRHERGDE